LIVVVSLRVVAVCPFENVTVGVPLEEPLTRTLHVNVPVLSVVVEVT
jgi:hypothetical protein